MVTLLAVLDSAIVIRRRTGLMTGCMAPPPLTEDTAYL